MTDKPEKTADTVNQYLLDHPEFFLTHAETLVHLELPHESGEAVSLIERQVEQLREQNAKLTSQLNQLVKVATENEVLMNRLHGLSLELMNLDDLGTFFDRLSEVLMEEFEADILNISLFDRDIETAEATPVYKVDRDDAELGQFRTQLEKGEASCGRLNRKKLDFLFHNRAQWVQSAALVPLGGLGMMAIGSSDPARFYPGMGTMFLDLLSRVMVHRLEREQPAEQRRSA